VVVFQFASCRSSIPQSISLSCLTLITGLSFREKKRVQKNHKASVSSHIERARARERAKVEEEERRRLLFEKTHSPDKQRRRRSSSRQNVNTRQASTQFHPDHSSEDKDEGMVIDGEYYSFEEINNNWIKCQARREGEEEGRFYYHNTLTGESRWNIDDDQVNKDDENSADFNRNQNVEGGFVAESFDDSYRLGVKGVQNRVLIRDRLKSAPRAGRPQNVEGEEEEERRKRNEAISGSWLHADVEGEKRGIPVRPTSSPAYFSQHQRADTDGFENSNNNPQVEFADQIQNNQASNRNGKGSHQPPKPPAPTVKRPPMSEAEKKEAAETKKRLAILQASSIELVNVSPLLLFTIINP
jgi:hypothetical protein